MVAGGGSFGEWSNRLLGKERRQRWFEGDRCGGRSLLDGSRWAQETSDKEREKDRVGREEREKREGKGFWASKLVPTQT